jgi:hypothetical protein
MLRALGLLATAGLFGCMGIPLEGACGRQRSVTVRDTLPDVALYLSLVEEAERADFISWEITPFRLNDITAVHLHDAIPGHGGRMLFDLTAEDTYPDDGITVAGGGPYSYDASIENLFNLVRSGSTYIDVHTGSEPEGAIRVDLAQVEFEDWSEYYCS